ncbi:protein Shroom3 isoform X3 [Gouania willdenowi]|uniref:protein Shroom3 isoform X3 n=1 Tax=Gouania willdenowi TaxID=441366 RepID=UPI001054DF15|nr:protein Shroom3-like isoform X3 [Gouania willdenowi]
MESGSRPGLQQETGRGGGGGWVLVEARLRGGAPWGFTLRGGLEHGEPLIISKVEEGGKAEQLEQSLLVGDEMIIINDVKLSGFRQEAIALIKGSHKALQLTVRRRSDPASRPHSWHSTKLADGQHKLDQGRTNMSGNWHHPHLTSASTIDLCGGFDSGGDYLRKSPDQYSSRGSMESLDPPLSSQLHHGAQQHHPLGNHGHSGSYPAYSSCHQLSYARSSNSIDHLHSKRDSAYSSFSTSSSIPEYLASTPSFSSERSYSMETVPQRGGGTVFDNQQGFSHDQELSSTSAVPQHIRESGEGGGGRRIQSQDLQGSVGGVCYYANSCCSSSSNGSSSGGISSLNRHSMGSLLGPPTSRSSYEDLKGAPAPPRRSDSYSVTKSHDRPNSWSSVEHARSLRSLQRGPWHHSSGSVASGTAKGSYNVEGQLHTVIEKSPESSPTTKPKQGGGFPQPFSQTDTPSGVAGSTIGFNQLTFPPSVFPIPQLDPQYAQAPSPSLQSGNSSDYPSLAKEAKQLEQQCMPAVVGRDEAPTEGGRDRKMSAENGYPHSSYVTSASTQLRTQANETQRHHKVADCTPSKAHNQSCVSNSKSQKGQRSLNNQQPNSCKLHGLQCKNQGHHTHVYQEQTEINHIYHTPSAPDLRALAPKEKIDGLTSVDPWEDRSRSVDQSSTHSEPVAYCGPAQGQMPPRHTSAHAHPQPHTFSTPQSTSRHFSDSAALHFQPLDHRVQESKDEDHLLTRLENALTEVQQIPSPDNVDFGNSNERNSFVDSSRGPVRTLSVLEKVSRFERREHAGKQQSLSTSASHSRGNHLRMIEKSRSSLCGAEDIRHMLERSTKGTKAHRTMSYGGGSSDHTKYGTPTPADPSSALQRSRSTLQVDGCADIHSSNEFPWRQEMQDMPSNRSYRDSLKNIQSKVLRSTSFRHRELSSSVSSIPSSGSSTFTSSSHQRPPVFAKTNFLEKKGPKIMPKPQGVILSPLSPLPIISPHTPKERHVVSPDVRGPSPPALPSLPPVGPPTTSRIRGRKRLTADQKKRSYSEPENMNEVGVSDPEIVALFRHKGETSVADRRKMFEHGHMGTGAPAIKCDLRKVQQDALAEYVGRKKSVKRDKSAQLVGSRPHSAYLQPDNSNYTDTHSLSSTSSLLSLQDIGQDKSFSSKERPLSSALPSGPDLQMIQSNLFYPDSLTAPRPKAHPPSSSSSKSSSELQGHIHPDLNHQGGRFGFEQKVAEPQANRGLTKPSNGALYRVGSTQSAGKSASAENLLESLEHGQISHQHHRSCSSPTLERLNQNVFPNEVKMFDVFFSEPGRCALATNRPSELHLLEGSDESQISGRSINTSQLAGSIQDMATSSTPNSRRERQRNSERQHAQSSSSLAASVGLPCPFSPPGTQDRNVSGWQVNERLSQANFDAITFPQTGIVDSEDRKGAAGDREYKQARHSLSDATLMEDSQMDSLRDRAFSLGTSGDRSMQKTKPFLPVTHLFLLSEKDTTITASSPLPVSHPSSNHHFSSLQISESSLFSSIDQRQERDICTDTPQEDLDDVFLQNPPQPSPSPLIKETNLMEDFPPPPSPLVKVTNLMEEFPPPPPPAELEQAEEKQTIETFLIMSSTSLKNFIIPTRTELLQSFPATPSPPVFTPIVPSPAPALEEIPTITASITVEDNMGLEYQPLPKRERTSEELRVEALAKQLVLQDPTLAPLLDTWGGQSIVERMEEIFISGKQTTNPHWPHKGSVQVEERIPDEVYNPNENTVTDGGMENILVDEEKDLTTRKVELCEALKSSITALQKEKEALHEEQQRHQDVGAKVETLVQEHLKPNEKDKYNMFIGDLDRIVNLLLSLFSRLSRVDQSLLTLRQDKLQEEVAKEQESLQHKRTLLLRQTEDAQELKENLDRRQRVVHTILSSYFTEPQLQDYHYFVSYKPSFLIHQRHLDDLIRQEEDQLTRLAESLPKEQAEAYGCFSLHFLGPAPFTPSLTPSIIPGTTYTPGSTTVTSL